jgi:uncharacterized membrane protein HdeD (DUF308 family)
MISAMTKDLRTAWLRVAAGVLLIAGAVAMFVSDSGDTESMVWQGIEFVLGLGLLAQGVAGLVTSRRRRPEPPASAPPDRRRVGGED